MAAGSGLDRSPRSGDKRPVLVAHSRSAIISSGDRGPVEKGLIYFMVKSAAYVIHDS